MEEVVYLNGSLVPRSQALISVFDHSFLYGYGLFETMRAYHGKIFLLERHIKRLLDSAEIIGLSPKLAGINFGKACLETARANRLEDARLRLTVSGGETDALPWVDISGEPTVVVTARPYQPFSAEVYHHGFRVRISSLRRCQSPVSIVKSTSYLVSVLARMEAATAGMDEALLLNDRGFVAEGGGSNVFFVKNSGLITPSLESGILPGVTRQLVIELAGALDVPVIEGDISLIDLESFDESFLTNSMIEVMPLVEVKDDTGKTISIGSEKPGRITNSLMAAYRERVTEEVG